MSTMASVIAGASAGSQSTVFVTMGADEGGGDCTSTSVNGKIFGLTLTSCNGGNGYGIFINAAGSASGQSFFRQMKIGTATFNTSAATYSSANNAWTWGNDITALAPLGTYTLRFFR